ncbi:MAG: acetate--CoA ligase family protein, partial [Thiolinea sp.]
KTEAGAVQLNLQSPEQVSAAIQTMQQAVAAYNPDAVSDQFLLEQMVPGAITELMVSIRQDEQFGLAMTLASGGIFIELIGDAVTLLLPCSEQEILTALDKLKISKLLDGFRGKPAVDRQLLAGELLKLAQLMESQRDEIAEVEINPLFVLEEGVCAVDVLMQKYT